MNLSDLSKIDVSDLKKIDYNQLLKEITKRPDTLVILCSSVLTLILCFYFFTSKGNLAKTLKREVSLLNEKVTAIEKYNKTKKELDSFQKLAPDTLTEEELINVISEIAFKRKIQIKSLVPQARETTTYYDTISINVEIEAPNYIKLWLFIHDIENSKTPLRIDGWEGSMDETSFLRGRRRTASTENDEKTNIEVRVDISTISYNNV